jgi:hypothetical protein
MKAIRNVISVVKRVVIKAEREVVREVIEVEREVVREVIEVEREVVREVIEAGTIIAELSEIAKVFIGLKSTVENKFNDKKAHPEIEKDVEIRRSNDLCKEEEDFLKERKEYIKEKFAKYVGVDVKKIDVNDIPVIAFAGSGGGFRAMIANTGKGN